MARKTKYIAVDIRLQPDLANICAAHATRLGISTEDYIAYVMLRSVDDMYREMDKAAAAAARSMSIKAKETLEP